MSEITKTKMTLLLRLKAALVRLLSMTFLVGALDLGLFLKYTDTLSPPLEVPL